MNKLIILTFNRSAKLRRTLRCYDQMRKILQLEIIILDGSDDVHQGRNIETSRLYSNINHINMMGSSFNERVNTYLRQIPPDSIVCIAPDEDVFLYEYLKDAFSFLTNNSDYSAYVGRYLTFGRPFIGLDRMTHWRDKINNIDINSDDFLRRASLLANTITVGCAPVFWGVRKCKSFLDIFELFDKLKYGPSAEVLDQVLLAFIGKIRFTSTPMLLRDETRLGYVYTEDRKHTQNYFPPEEEDLVYEILVNFGGNELGRAGRFFLDRYSRKFVLTDDACFSLQVHNKSYTNYMPIDPIDSFSPKLIGFLMKGVTVFSEMISAQIAKKHISKKYGSRLINIFFERIATNDIG
jgi:glycosyltransferase domain-containing protein